MKNSMSVWKAAAAGLRAAVVCVGLCALPALGDVRGSGLTVSIPNGYANVEVDDLVIRTTAGPVRWTRYWDGLEWKFNPHWESLSQSWKNLTGSQVADTTGSASAAGGASVTSVAAGGGDSSGCWALVDEDWIPSTGTVIVGGEYSAGAMLPIRMTPFNRIIGDTPNPDQYMPPQRVNIDYATLCMGAVPSSGVQDLEAVRRLNELYVGEGGRYAFNNRTTLEKRPVRQLPPLAVSAADGVLAAGRVSLAPESNAKGYRWADRGGDWIDYNTQGQIVAYGDRNNNTIWFVRDTTGRMRGVLDANGRVVFSLHYQGDVLTEVRDYPDAEKPFDLPARRVQYQYDTQNRLTAVVDVRGNTWRYGYDARNHITKLTDAEGREELLAYSGDSVKTRTAPDGGITDYVFDYDDTNKQFISKITGPETAAGRMVEDYTHNRAGKLVRQLINGVTYLEVKYDTGARAEYRTNARGFTTRVTRNEFGQTTLVDLSDGGALRASYSTAHLGITEEVDQLGLKLQYDYDAKGNRVRMVEASGTADERVTAFELDQQGRRSKIIRKGRTEADGTITLDAVWQYEYDGSGQIKRTVDPEGGVREYEFDRAGNITSAMDPRGHEIRFVVDSLGNLTRITNAQGRAIELSYDKVGNQTGYVDGRGKVVQMAYDAMNRQTQTVNASGGVYTVQYNAQGLPVSRTDEDGRKSQFQYDNFIRLAKMIDGLGNVTEYGYQLPDGSLGTLFSPTQTKYPTFAVQARYDTRERVTGQALLNPNQFGTEGVIDATAYDKRGQVTSETDPNGKASFYAYDGLGRLTEFTDTLGNKTKAVRDVRGNLIALTDAKGSSTRYQYDRADRLIKEILPMGQSTAFQYDAAGNLATLIDPAGNRTSFTYDELNRPVRTDRYSAAGILARVTTYVYDAAGNMTNWTDLDKTRPVGQQTTSGSRTYDDDNRKVSETLTVPDAAGTEQSFTYGYGYSPAGYKTGLTWIDGTQIGYGYSAHGELESVVIPGEGSISVSEFKWTAPAKVTLPGGGVEERSLDGLLQLEGLNVKAPGQQVTLNLSNTYGKVQELRSRTETNVARAASTTVTADYSYDDETRLIQATTDKGGLFGSDTESFTLDAVGNRIAHSRVSGAWTYDGNNRLVQRGTGANATVYEYDLRGSLTKKTEPGDKVTQYAHDAANQLVAVRDGSGKLIARYGYDPFGRRIWKEQYQDSRRILLNPGRRTVFIYADEGLIAEVTQPITLDANESVTARGPATISAQYGPTPDGNFGTDVLYVKARNSNGDDVVAYYHRDNIGTPLQATDKAGSVVWTASYNVFGAAQVMVPEATPENPNLILNLRLPGQYLDEETDLHQNWHRYYDPSIGRYIQTDPIGLHGGLNTYEYAGANPLTYYDPYGLWTWGDPLPQGLVDFSAGLGDALLLGTGGYLREKLGIDGGVDTCSSAYKWGGRASFVLGAGRIAYAGLAKAGSVLAASGIEASAFRNGLKAAFRLGIGKSWRPPNLSKYPTDEALRAAAGRTNLGMNAYGGGVAAAGAAGATCGCAD